MVQMIYISNNIWDGKSDGSCVAKNIFGSWFFRRSLRIYLTWKNFALVK